MTGSPPTPNISGRTLIRWAIGDFSAVWNAMATAASPPTNGANFLFGTQAAVALELLARLCHGDDRTEYRAAAAAALMKCEPRYYSRIPGTCPRSQPGEMTLPVPPTVVAEETVLGALFDLCRNGLVHQYQQIPVELASGEVFGFAMGGVQPGATMDRLRVDRDPDHLLVMDGSDASPPYALIRVNPAVLLLDVEAALDAAEAQLPDLASVDITHLSRPRAKGGDYDFALADLRDVLRRAGHPSATPDEILARAGAATPDPPDRSATVNP